MEMQTFPSFLLQGECRTPNKHQSMQIKNTGSLDQFYLIPYYFCDFV